MKALTCRTIVLHTLALLLGASSFTTPLPASAAQEDAALAIRTHGVKLNVEDMDKALSFYCDTLGFVIDNRSRYPQQVSLKTGERIKLILQTVKALRPMVAKESRAALTLQVNDLDQAIAKLKAKGVKFAETEKRTEGVGQAISIVDPFGRAISLMHQTIVKVEPFPEPKIYNFGYTVPDMQVAREFYSRTLGFVVRSEKYLPLDLPLGHADKTFAFMLHYRPGTQPVADRAAKAAPFTVLVYETENLDGVIAKLKRSGVTVWQETEAGSGQGRGIRFADPFGNLSELVEVAK